MKMSEIQKGDLVRLTPINNNDVLSVFTVNSSPMIGTVIELNTETDGGFSLSGHGHATYLAGGELKILDKGMWRAKKIKE